MIFILFICLGGWIISLLGWWNEHRYRKNIVKAIKSDLKAEINWIKLNHYQDIKQKEIKTLRKAIEIVERYEFD